MNRQGYDGKLILFVAVTAANPMLMLESDRADGRWKRYADDRVVCSVRWLQGELYRRIVMNRKERVERNGAGASQSSVGRNS